MEANSVCEKDKRKTIAAEHVVQAMKVGKRKYTPLNLLDTRPDVLFPSLPLYQDLEWTKHAPILEATMLAEREEAKVITPFLLSSR